MESTKSSVMIFPSKPDRAFFMALMFSTWHNSFWYTFSITAVLCGTALVPEGHANYWRTTGHSTRGSLQLQLQLGVERSVVRAPSRILRFSLPPFPYVLGHRSLFFSPYSLSTIITCKHRLRDSPREAFSWNVRK